MCKSVSGPIFGLCSEHLSVLFRIIGFIRSQTRRNSTTSTIAEANLDVTQSIFVRSRQRSTTYRLKRSSDVAYFPCGVNNSRLQVRVASYADALWACHEFLPHERLLQRALTSVHGGGPITGRLPFFGKRDFDPCFISRKLADD